MSLSGKRGLRVDPGRAGMVFSSGRLTVDRRGRRTFFSRRAPGPDEEEKIGVCAFFWGRERTPSARYLPLAVPACRRKPQTLRVARWRTGKTARQRGENGARGEEGQRQRLFFRSICFPLFLVSLSLLARALVGALRQCEPPGR